MLVMPNAWDAASAKVFEAAQFPAIATTSGGVALALGYADHEGAPVDEMLAAAGRIARAVTIPVTVDFEAGYGLSPTDIVRRVIEAGCVGMNLEDSDHHGATQMVGAELQAERLAQVKAAIRSAGIDLLLNARVDVFIHRLGTPEEQLVEGIRRARLYREAGADCIYPIILRDEQAITTLVGAVGPINITMRRGGPLTLERLAALGVSRVTYATSLFRDTMASVEAIAQEIFAALPPAARR